jgi:hypothetical protein
VWRFRGWLILLGNPSWSADLQSHASDSTSCKVANWTEAWPMSLTDPVDVAPSLGAIWVSCGRGLPGVIIHNVESVQVM